MEIKIKAKPDRDDYSSLRYRVTPFSAAGHYPRGIFSFPTSAFVADEEVVFAVTHCSTWRSREDLPYSEVDWMKPELVRLLGSLMFCERFTERRCWFYPRVHTDVILGNDHLDLQDHGCISQIKAAVIGDKRFTSPALSKSEWQGIGAEGFLFDAGELSIDLCDAYWQRISTSNLLLMRGIQALVKCDMLAKHEEFQEESAIAAFIALDASFEMIRRHLQSEGIPNPSAADAATWFHNAFDAHLGYPPPADGKFFGDFYPQRIQTLHPGSRLGDAPFAALSIDDRIHLRQSLPGLFAYLLTGVHSPDWLDWIAEAQRNMSS